MGYQNQQSKCQLECQLTQINDTVQNLKCELGQLQQERLLMEQQRQMISPTAMNACTNPQLGREATCNSQLRELREQYNRLQDDFKNKIIEVATLRNENVQLRQMADEARAAQEAAEANARALEEKLKRNNNMGQFDEKLQELSPLPDLLTATQAKMKEVQQQKALADQKLAEMERELHEANQKIAALMRQMQDSQISLESGMSEKDKLKAAIKEWENKFNELKDINADLKTQLVQMDQLAAQNQLKLQEKLHEVSQLIAQLESIREESARQVSRTKDRSEMVRRNLQRQISELEKELAQSRATARAAQKERDEVR
ncbi:hypothetical protein C0J52_11938 [Blattella germanica]|nr:hypothetical protein C0J52_11938 [Blattella germanica]